MKKKRLVFSVALLLFSFLAYASQVDVSAPVTLDIKGMDILDVLKIISLRSGLSIATSPLVRGKVTVFLKDVSVWDAFEILIAANDLAYEKRKNLITVMTNKEYKEKYGKPFYDLRVIRRYDLKNAKAISLGETISELKSDIGKVIIDSFSNSIIVLDAPDVIYEIDKIIKSVDSPLETRVIQLNYTRVEDIKENVVDLVNKDVGIIKFDQTSNRVVVTDIPSNVEHIEKILIAFDKRPQAVKIEAKIVQITLSDEYRLGVDWEGVFGKHLGISYSGNFSLPSSGSAGVGQIAVGKAALDPSAALDGHHQYSGIIKAFDTYGKSDVLSSPHITVLDGQEAYVLVGDKEPIVSVSITYPESGEAVYAESVEYMETGVRLSVTPYISDDGFITMHIKPEVSSGTEVEGALEGSIYIKKTTSEAETTVIVKDGDTIVLAGLMKETEIDGREKVPGIGDIPFIGKLFSEKHKKKVKTELVILLTPRIVGNVKQAFSESVAEFANEQIGYESPKADSAGLTRSFDHAKTELILAEDKERSSYSEYYLKITNIIYDYFGKNYLNMGLNREVNIVFLLNSRGGLIGEPAVVGEVDSTIRDLAIEVIKKAGPYPAFPISLNKEKEAFNILLNF
ncbi:MAG: secretin N-terminal domain-containing protein [Candidatus Kaelpia aquatica]|nr:secretin N-terminal domain-containing protein [Candidatus Kaelpia aquatica]